MIDQQRLRDLAAEVKSNHAALEACPGHEFAKVECTRSIGGHRYRCARCGGLIDGVAHHWYERGRRDAA